MIIYKDKFMSSLTFVFLSLFLIRKVFGEDGEIGFDVNYKVIWGGDHVVYMNQGKEIQLSMDEASGILYFCFLLP